MTETFKPFGLFAEREELQDAIDYVDTLATAAGENAITVYTATYVLYNTVAHIANNRIGELEAAMQDVLNHWESGDLDLAVQRMHHTLRKEN